MTLARPIGSAILVVLEDPRTWLLALAGFLARGGIVLLVLPVIVLPTATGIGNAIGPDLAALVFGGPSPRLIAGAIVAAVVFTGWLLGGGLAAAETELELVAIAWRSEERVADTREPAATAGRLLLARLLCHLPLLLVAGLGIVRLVAATYAELIRPGDLAVPVAIRVIQAVPEVLLSLLLAWLAGEAVGAVAARRLAAGGGSILRAVAWSARRVVTSPATLGAFLVPLVVSAALLLPALIAASVTWRSAQRILRSVDDPLLVAAGVALFVAVWGAALLMSGLTAAWRSAVLSLALADVLGHTRDVRGMAS